MNVGLENDKTFFLMPTVHKPYKVTKCNVEILAELMIDQPDDCK
jgi:hypothetical protein